MGLPSFQFPPCYVLLVSWHSAPREGATEPCSKFLPSCNNRAPCHTAAEIHKLIDILARESWWPFFLQLAMLPGIISWYVSVGCWETVVHTALATWPVSNLVGRVSQSWHVGQLIAPVALTWAFTRVRQENIILFDSNRCIILPVDLWQQLLELTSGWVRWGRRLFTEQIWNTVL